MLTYLLDLPSELIIQSLSYLSIDDLDQMCQVSKNVNGLICQSPLLWKAIYPPSDLPKNIDFKYFRLVHKMALKTIDFIKELKYQESGTITFNGEESFDFSARICSGKISKAYKERSINLNTSGLKEVDSDYLGFEIDLYDENWDEPLIIQEEEDLCPQCITEDFNACLAKNNTKVLCLQGSLPTQGFVKICEHITALLKLTVENSLCPIKNNL